MQLHIQQVLPTYFDENVKERSEIWGKDFTFSKGELIQIVAPSGSGKTSLVHFLYGLRTEYKGTIRYGNTNIRELNAEGFANYRKDNISVVFQDLRLFPEQTILENLEIKRQLNPYTSKERMVEMVEHLGISSRLGRKARICSYGEQQRAVIIRALLQPFDFLLLDEPFSHLDTENAKKAMALMLEEAEKRKAAIVFADLERIDFFPHNRLLHL